MGRWAILLPAHFLGDIFFLSAFREAVSVFSGLFGAQINAMSFSLFIESTLRLNYIR